MKKLIKKYVSVFLLTIFCTSSTIIPIQAASVPVETSNNIVGTLIDSNSVTSSIATLSVPSAYTYSWNPQLNIDSISISDNNIEVVGDIDGEDICLEGNIFDSYTQKDGYKSYVSNMVDKENNYKVIYCYIQLNSKYYKYSFDDQLRDKPMFLLYLQDKTGNLIVFEQELSDLNINLEEVEKNNYPLADSIDDYLWFFKVSEPTENEIVENVMQLSTEYGSTVSPIVLRTSVIGGEEFRVSAWGKIEASISEHTAQTTLYLQEFVYKESELYSNDTPFAIVYPYGSSTTMGKIIVGDNTTIQNYRWSGNYYVGGSLNASVTAGLSLGYFAPFAGIGLNFSLGYTGPLEVNSAEVCTYPNNNTWPRAALIKSPDNKELSLQNHGQHLNFIAGIASILNDYVSTEAQFAWSFQIDFGAEVNQYSVTDLPVTIPYSLN